MKQNPTAFLKAFQSFRRAFSTTGVRHALEFTDQHRALQSTVSKVGPVGAFIDCVAITFGLIYDLIR